MPKNKEQRELNPSLGEGEKTTDTHSEDTVNIGKEKPPRGEGSEVVEKRMSLKEVQDIVKDRGKVEIHSRDNNELLGYIHKVIQQDGVWKFGVETVVRDYRKGILYGNIVVTQQELEQRFCITITPFEEPKSEEELPLLSGDDLEGDRELQGEEIGKSLVVPLAEMEGFEDLKSPDDQKDRKNKGENQQKGEESQEMKESEELYGSLWEQLTHIRDRARVDHPGKPEEADKAWAEAWNRIFDNLKLGRNHIYEKLPNGSFEMRYLKLIVDEKGQKITKDSVLKFEVYDSDGNLLRTVDTPIQKMKYYDFRELSPKMAGEEIVILEGGITEKTKINYAKEFADSNSNPRQEISVNWKGREVVVDSSRLMEYILPDGKKVITTKKNTLGQKIKQRNKSQVEQPKKSEQPETEDYKLKEESEDQRSETPPKSKQPEKSKNPNTYQDWLEGKNSEFERRQSEYDQKSSNHEKLRAQYYPNDPLEDETGLPIDPETGELYYLDESVKDKNGWPIKLSFYEHKDVREVGFWDHVARNFRKSEAIFGEDRVEEVVEEVRLRDIEENRKKVRELAKQHYPEDSIDEKTGLPRDRETGELYWLSEEVYYKDRDTGELLKMSLDFEDKTVKGITYWDRMKRVFGQNK